MTLRYLTAGESHGPALVGILEGMPAGVPVAREHIGHQLARRRLGTGRSPRMAWEGDDFELLGGVRHGATLGSPVAVLIRNAEWDKWAQAMSPDPPADPEAVAASGRGQPLTRPRPGHADLVGSQKYGYDDVRDALERASARETAARVALATVARELLTATGIAVVSHTVRIGEVSTDAPAPSPEGQAEVDTDPVRCADPAASQAMVAAIERAKSDRDTLGGVVEVVATGLPPGLGSHVHWDRKLDTRLAGALMSIQAFKGVEIGQGFASAATPGSAAHDEIELAEDGYTRRTGRSGGLEGGMTTGGPLRVRAAMKPLSSLAQPLATVDTHTGEPAQAITQRSDVCAVPRAGVVCEAVVALELAAALLDKTGGDSLAEVQRNLAGYRADLSRRSPSPGSPATAGETPGWSASGGPGQAPPGDDPSGASAAGWSDSAPDRP
jgi:chorismate synthase